MKSLRELEAYRAVHKQQLIKDSRSFEAALSKPSTDRTAANRQTASVLEVRISKTFPPTAVDIHRRNMNATDAISLSVFPDGTYTHFSFSNFVSLAYYLRAGQLSQYSDWLRVGRSGDRIPVGARFSAPVQTGPGAHPASCTMGTRSFPGAKRGLGVALTTHPFQCRGQERVELYLYSHDGPYGLYRASVPVQGCTLLFSLLHITYLTLHHASFATAPN